MKDNSTSKRKIDVKNTVIKFVLDQTLGATFNTVLFIAGIGALKGMGTNKIVESIKKVWIIKLTNTNPFKTFWITFNRIRGHYTLQERNYGLRSL